MGEKGSLEGLGFASNTPGRSRGRPSGRGDGMVILFALHFNFVFHMNVVVKNELDFSNGSQRMDQWCQSLVNGMRPILHQLMVSPNL